MMIKQLLESILLKKAKKNKVSKEDMPAFKITENGPVKSDFEVTELSYEEYVKFASSERRHQPQPVVYDRRNPSGAHRTSNEIHA